MVNDRFIKLLTKELSDELTHGEHEELKLLLQNSKHLRDQRDILKEYWKTDDIEYAANAAMFKKVLEKIKAEENVDTNEIYNFAKEKATRKTFRFYTWYSAAAIALVAISMFAYYSSLFYSNNNEVVAVKWLKKTTKPAVKSVITLTDGTVITLNSATTLKYPDHFGNKTREVYLDGEAYFDVHKDHLHPFIIHTNHMNVRVLGTSFNVKSYKNEFSSETTLIRGSVEVTLNDRPSDRIILKPKEKLIVQNSTYLKKVIGTKTDIPNLDNTKSIRYSLTNLTYLPNNDTTIVETSWVNNKLVFSDKTFPEVAEQLERWYGVHIEFTDSHVKNYRFTGLYENETLPQALQALKMIEHFNYKIDKSTVYIY